MSSVDGQGQWRIYYFASRCKAAWMAFEDHKDDWGNDPEQHQWWTMGLHLEGDRLAKSIGYHIAAGYIVKVPSWVNFFIHSTHPQEAGLASLPPVNLRVDSGYMDDPSRIVTTYHADWWNSPGGGLVIPAAYSEEEKAAFHDWWKLANLPLIEHPPAAPHHINLPGVNTPAARVLDCFQSALLRIEQALATWRNISDCARSDIGCLEHLMDEVQQGRLDLTLSANLPIPQGPWRNIRPMRSSYIYPFKSSGHCNTSSEGSDIAVSPKERIIGDGLPPAEMVTDSTSPTAVPPDFAPPEGNNRDEYYPSPVSSTGLDWEFSEEGSDHESSVDFVMSEHSEDATHSNSESE